MSRDKYIVKTKTGFRTAIRIDSVLYRKRWKADTDPFVMRQWVFDVQMRHRTPRTYATGAFDADAQYYLTLVTTMPTYAQRKHHIERWIAAFGSMPRSTVTAAMIRQQLMKWQGEPQVVPVRVTGGAMATRTLTRGLSPASLNKIRTSLMHLYSVLDGKASVNPVRDVPKFAAPKEEARGIDYATIEKIFAAMPICKAKARLMVLAYTGLPPNEIDGITPEHVNAKARTVLVGVRDKGAGAAGRVLPLTPKAIKAFELMARTQAWGTSSRSGERMVFRRACIRALGSVRGLKPYDLRHSFGTDVYAKSGDIRATQVLMLHSTPQLTHRYTLAAVDARLTAAIKGVGNAKKRSA